MSKGRYPYPQDDFDAVDAAAGPRGVHRRARSAWTRMWPFLVVLIVFPAVAYGIVTLLTGTNITASGLFDDTSTESAGAPASTPTDSTGATGAATTDPAASVPASTPASAPPAAAPQLATAVSVYNSTSVKGLASKAVTALKNAGFTSVTSGNYTKGALAKSTVFYGTADLQPTAQAAATALGISTVTLDSKQAGKAIAVVLEKDYTP